MKQIKCENCVSYWYINSQLCKTFWAFWIYELRRVYDYFSYFERHSCKQFINGKLIRFGYKTWCLSFIKSVRVSNFKIQITWIRILIAVEHHWFNDAKRISRKCKVTAFWNFYWQSIYKFQFVSTIEKKGNGVTSSEKNSKNCPHFKKLWLKKQRCFWKNNF